MSFLDGRRLVGGDDSSREEQLYYARKSDQAGLENTAKRDELYKRKLGGLSNVANSLATIDMRDNGSSQSQALQAAYHNPRYLNAASNILLNTPAMEKALFGNGARNRDNFNLEGTRFQSVTKDQIKQYGGNPDDYPSGAVAIMLNKKLPEKSLWDGVTDGVAGLFGEEVPVTQNATSDKTDNLVLISMEDVDNAVKNVQDQQSTAGNTPLDVAAYTHEVANEGNPHALNPLVASGITAQKNMSLVNPVEYTDRLYATPKKLQQAERTSKKSGTQTGSSSRGSGSKNLPSNTELEQELVKTYVKEADKLSNFTGDISSKNPDTILAQYNSLKTKLENQKKGGSLSLQQVQAVDVALKSLEGVPDFAMQLAIQKQNDGKGFTPEGWSDSGFWSDTRSAVPELWDMWDPTASFRANMKVLAGISDPKGYPVVGNPNYLNHLQINENNNITWTPGTTDDEILENRNKPMGVFGVSDDTTAGDPINFGQIESDYPLTAQYLRGELAEKDKTWRMRSMAKNKVREQGQNHDVPLSPAEKQQALQATMLSIQAQKAYKNSGQGELEIGVTPKYPSEKRPIKKMTAKERERQTQVVIQHGRNKTR
jgi:hypothetical protein